MATSSLYGSVSESTGLYGIGAASGGTYFEWFVFYDSATAPATPTGGSWSFTTNTGTAPSGWLNAPPASPVNQIWVSIAVVDSRSTSSLTWSTPGLMTGSGLPILTGTGNPSAGTGLNSQLYIRTDAAPQSMWVKESGTWVQLTGLSIYALAGPNDNITSLSGITGGISSATYLQLNTAGDGATAPGKFQWDTTWGGPQVGMTGGNVNLQIGQETLIYVYNNTGSTLTDGQIVYVTGSQGQRVTVALAQANSDATSATIIGMVTESIPTGSSGFVTTQGMVNNISTSGAADGAVVYLSPTTPGAWTTTKPQAPQHMVMVGYVVKGNSGGGSIYVHPQNGYELDELHDVKITGVANGNMLRYNSTIPAWENVAGPTGTLVGTTDTQTLTNKTISGASNTLSNIGNSSLTNSAITINGNSVSLGGSTTVTANTPNSLVFGAGLTASGNFDGSTSTSVALQAVGTAGVYGSAASVPVITTDAYGRVSGVANTAISIPASQVTGLGSMLTQNANNVALTGGSITGVAISNLPNPLAIADGGTGATTASAARTNLGLGTIATYNAAVANGAATLDASGYLTTAQIPPSLSSGTSYRGTWNASTNSPELASGVGTRGYYYVVTTAGSTTLDGISSWAVGDWAIYNGTVWQKLTYATIASGNFVVLTENNSPVVVQTDIGSGPNEIPLNQYLGKMAYKDVVGMNATLNPAPTIASAATIQPLNPIVFVSGTTTINTITVPAEFVGGGQITIIPTGLWSTGTSGNIALATTAVVSKALIMFYDAVTAKWYPSY